MFLLCSVSINNTTMNDDNEDDDEYEDVSIATAPGDVSDESFLAQYQTMISVLVAIFLILLIGLWWFFINKKKVVLESELCSLWF